MVSLVIELQPEQSVIDYWRATTSSDTLLVDQTYLNQWNRCRLVSSILHNMPLEEWPAARVPHRITLRPAFYEEQSG
ncbi:MAG: hypothetical protein ACREMZ_03130 [Gemmatimonadales bacterium]